VGLASQLDDFVAERGADPAWHDKLIAECEAEIRREAEQLLRRVAA
jgi:hypothetical protein